MNQSIGELSSFEIDPNQYKIIQMIGAGHFGSAYLAQDIQTGDYCALKQIPCQMMSPIQQEYLNREIKIMAQVSHPALLCLKGYSTPFKSSKPDDNIATIIMDFMNNGSLFNVLELAKANTDMPYWNPTTKNKMLIGIASGMKYLHDMKIIHRDLKPENVLLDEHFEPKITDFGLSKVVDKYNHTRSQKNTPNIGTPLYMPPEIFSNKPYSFKVDVFAFGVISYEIITGLSLYPEVTSPVELGIKICNGERLSIPDSVTSDFRNLISRCWAQDARQRPTFEEIYSFLVHPNTYLPGSDLSHLNQYKKKMREAEFNSKLNPTIKWTTLENQLMTQNNQMDELQHSLQELIMSSKKNNEILRGNLSTVKNERLFIEKELQSSLQKNNELIKSITQRQQQIQTELRQLDQQIKPHQIMEIASSQIEENNNEAQQLSRMHHSKMTEQNIRYPELKSPPLPINQITRLCSHSPTANRPASLQLRFTITQFNNIHDNSFISDQPDNDERKVGLSNRQADQNNSPDALGYNENDEFLDNFGYLDQINDFNNINEDDEDNYNCFESSSDYFFEPNDDQNKKKSKKKKDKQKAFDDKNSSTLCTPRKNRFHFPRRISKIATNVELTA